MSLTRKIPLAMLVAALGVGLAACNKPTEPVSEASTAEQMGYEAGNIQQSTNEALDNASAKMKSAAEDAKDSAADLKQSAKDAQADFKEGYEAGKN